MLVAKTREQAIASYLKVALEYRASYKRPRSLGRSVALKAVRKAKRIRDAEDWWDEYINKGL